MVQRKKDNVREAILAAAFELFTQKGYSETTVPAIARMAGFSTANVYVYFESKIQILFSLYTPWLEKRLDKLDGSLRRISDPRLRLNKLLMVLWRDLPKENNGFAHNIVEAVSSSSGQNDYDPRLRDYFVGRVAEWLQGCTAMSDQGCRHAATVMVMAFDGFAANVGRKHGVACSGEMVELFSDLLLRRPAGSGFST
ncbi:MAG TPA: TetR/AcrR family transcriptional regulator [Phenylobacterium sp.]|uniref:TetR/AcrR family transcriptional regulator n=1 Tax=Phenylobacterium sp. TaxID=1871053 RepID=UPI002B45EB2A|nr:TetR/AcrR family transcriptional regulator [Phenylobacterium sp.]HKR88494.1 TetR/AcrR family transcriptional regulator [Phenylobacterium sp.]